MASSDRLHDTRVQTGILACLNPYKSKGYKSFALPTRESLLPPEDPSSLRKLTDNTSASDGSRKPRMKLGAPASA